ncbi:hypothetical protein Cdeb_01191 [Caldibacillus debilis GB1]|uniref:Uncharacterized protein n=1 Tax=Caldibacillus debilis GB1 TaxID=1339248 RepID=A0A420VDY1_9BACI|nr:hypothetical protein Cdeb_01191 [Caldibacillus debilis GB1]
MRTLSIKVNLSHVLQALKIEKESLLHVYKGRDKSHIDRKREHGKKENAMPFLRNSKHNGRRRFSTRSERQRVLV